MVFSSATSCRSWSSSVVVVILETEGVATSMTLSASWAKSVMFPVSGIEARTIRTFGSSHCKKSSRIKAASVLSALSHPKVAASGVIAGMASCHLTPRH